MAHAGSAILKIKFHQCNYKNFLIFCVILGCLLIQYVRESDFYFEDNVLGFFGLKGPKKRFFNFYQKKTEFYLNFSDFLHQFTAMQNLKNDLFLEKSFFKTCFEFFFSENLQLRFLGQKGPELTQNEVFKF